MAAMAAEVAARVVRAALTAAVAEEGAESERSAGPSPNGGPLAPSPVCKEEVAPAGDAVLSSWAALETVEGYSYPLPLAFTLALTLTPSLTPTLAPSSHPTPIPRSLP